VLALALAAHPVQRRVGATGQGRPEGARDLIARGVLLARDLGVGGAAAHPLDPATAEARGDALARRQLAMTLGERAPAPWQR
jgi:hypothetical protein